MQKVLVAGLVLAIAGCGVLAGVSVNHLGLIEDLEQNFSDKEGGWLLTSPITGYEKPLEDSEPFGRTLPA